MLLPGLVKTVAFGTLEEGRYSKKNTSKGANIAVQEGPVVRDLVADYTERDGLLPRGREAGPSSMVAPEPRAPPAIFHTLKCAFGGTL
jgi:hypothetical protein